MSYPLAAIMTTTNPTPLHTSKKDASGGKWLVEDRWGSGSSSANFKINNNNYSSTSIGGGTGSAQPIRLGGDVGHRGHSSEVPELLMVSTGTLTTNRSQSTHDSIMAYETPPSSARVIVGSEDVDVGRPSDPNPPYDYGNHGDTNEDDDMDEYMVIRQANHLANNSYNNPVTPSQSFRSCLQGSVVDDDVYSQEEHDDEASMMEESGRPVPSQRSLEVRPETNSVDNDDYVNDVYYHEQDRPSSSSISGSSGPRRPPLPPTMSDLPSSQMDTFMKALAGVPSPPEDGRFGSPAQRRSSNGSGTASHSNRSNGSSSRRGRRPVQSDRLDFEVGGGSRRGLDRSSSSRVSSPSSRQSSYHSRMVNSNGSVDHFEDIVAFSPSHRIKASSFAAPSPAPAVPQAPISWHRRGRPPTASSSSMGVQQPKRSSSMSAANRMNYGMMYSSFNSFGRDETYDPFPAQGSESFASLGAYSTGMLSTFLEQSASRHGRPSAAHTVCGNPSSPGKVSVVLSTDDGSSKTVQVNGKEARIIESLLLTANESSPSKKKEAVMGWIQSAAAAMLSPSQHGTVVDSGRLSTRSSLMVEVSPPFAEKKDLRAYLDRRRAKDRKGSPTASANTVAGDRGLGRYHGHSTEDVVNSYEMQKRRRPSSASPSSRRARELIRNSASTAKSGEIHSRQDEHDGINTGMGGSLQSFFDCASPPPVSRAHSIAGERPGRFSSRRDKDEKRPRSSSDPRRSRRESPQTPNASLNASKEFELDDFRAVRSAPTNRRTMMRRMHEVPKLAGIEEKSSSGGGKKEGRSRSRSRGMSKGNDSFKLDSPTQVEASTEEELNKSFLDQFLDHDVEANDSASQLLSPNGSKKKMDEYKASLVDGPIQDSASKLRIEPDFLESSQRIILQDPVDRRDGLKKMKSVPSSIDGPSQGLVDLFVAEDSPLDVIQEKKKSGAKSKAKAKSKSTDAKKKTSKPKAKTADDTTKIKSPKKKKSKTTKQKKPPAKELTSSESKEIKTRAPSPEKVTLRDLPRQSTTSTSQSKLRISRTMKKAKSLSNLDIRSYDTHDKLVLIDRLKSLSKTMSEPEKKSSVENKGNGLKSPNVKRCKSTKKLIPTESPRGDMQNCENVLNDHDNERPRSLRNLSPKKAARKKSNAAATSASKDKRVSSEKVSGQTTDDDEIIEVSKSNRKSPRSTSRKSRSSSNRLRPNSMSNFVEKTEDRPHVLARSHSISVVASRISEGSVLEIDTDDTSVCSELTDHFSIETVSLASSKPEGRRGKIRRPKSFSSRGLSTIGESRSATSWADLSNSDSLTKDEDLHLSRRWSSQSPRNVGVADTGLKSPRRSVDKVEKRKKGIKKLMTKLPFMK